ncbi:hypothetical protein NQ315_003513, partial [Exocentrus adspersus]
MKSWLILFMCIASVMGTLELRVENTGRGIRIGDSLIEKFFLNAFRRLRESGIKQSRSGGPRPRHTVAQQIAVQYFNRLQLVFPTTTTLANTTPVIGLQENTNYILLKYVFNSFINVTCNPRHHIHATDEGKNQKPKGKAFYIGLAFVELGSQKKKEIGNTSVQNIIRVPGVTVLDDPTISTRRISTQLQLPHNFVWKTINRELLHPYHRQKVHHLLPGDEVQRLAFCNWLLEQNDQNPSFINQSIFTRNGINITHNEHTWSLQNPHSVRIRGFQQIFSVYAWCGIFNRQVLPIQILPNRLNADAYLAFLKTNLQDLLDDIPIGLQNRMWYQHDGAPTC